MLKYQPYNWKSNVIGALRDLLSVALILWAFASALIIIELSWDFFHGSHAFWELAIMIPTMIIVFAIVLFLIIFLSFPVSQVIQNVAFQIAYRHTFKFRMIMLPIVLAVCAVLSFECYDFLVPSFRWYTDADGYWVHGITATRLGIFAIIQILLGILCWRRIKSDRADSKLASEVDIEEK